MYVIENTLNYLRQLIILTEIKSLDTATTQLKHPNKHQFDISLHSALKYSSTQKQKHKL